MTDCTVGRSAVTGRACGAAAIVSGRFADGVEWGCCEEHATEQDRRAARQGDRAGQRRVGDIVEVWRNGRAYEARVVQTGPRGGARARVTYANGSQRTVRV
jgi:hypothetical protein